MTDDKHREAFERFKMDVSERICNINPPDSISDLRKEYWKAGARRVIHEVNLALDAAMRYRDEKEGKV